MTLSMKPTGALVRHCGGAENTGARSKTRAPVLFHGTCLVGLVRKPTRKVWPSTNALFQWCAPSAGARLPPQGNALPPLITSPALRLHAGCTTSAEMHAGE